MSKIRKNMTGQRRGKLYFINVVDKVYNNKENAWLCKCDCGNQTLVPISASERKRSCGKCKVLDISGQKFHRLTAIKFSIKKNHKAYWLFKCECGTEKVIRKNLVTSGGTKSCGCLSKEKSSQLGIKHRNNWIKSQQYKWIYKNIRMRSSYEVMMAKALDDHQIEWQYEPRIIRLRKDMAYIPDFYLPEHNKWVEVKGVLTDKAKEKIALFKDLGYDLDLIMKDELEDICGSSYKSFIKNYRK